MLGGIEPGGRVGQLSTSSSNSAVVGASCPDEERATFWQRQRCCPQGIVDTILPQQGATVHGCSEESRGEVRQGHQPSNTATAALEPWCGIPPRVRVTHC